MTPSLSRRTPSLLLACFLLWMIPHLSFGQSLQACVYPEAPLAIDHVVLAVNDLDQASSTFLNLGFTLKKGRPHANGIINQHAKFRDATEIELLSLEKEPSDEITKGYATFLQRGEGGAFLALVGSLESIGTKAEEVGAQPKIIQSQQSTYLTFQNPSWAHLFVIEKPSTVIDPDSLLNHTNGTNGINAVWLDASKGFEDVVLGLGAKKCGLFEVPGDRFGMAYGVSNGVLILLNTNENHPRVQGVSLKRVQKGASRIVFPDDAHGIWLNW